MLVKLKRENVKSLMCSEKIRFIIIGGVNTLFGYGCFFVLFHFWGAFLNYLVITALSHFISVCFSFSLYRNFVFYSHAGGIPWEFLKYNLAVLNGLGIGIFLMFVFVRYAGMSPVVAQAMMMMVLIITNYVTHKYFTFSKKKGEKHK